MLEQLLGSSNQNIAWAAHMALQLQQQHQSGELSSEEYAELLQDLVRDRRISELQESLEQKIMLEQAINAAIAIAGNI